MVLNPYQLAGEELSQQPFPVILANTADEGKGKFCFAFGSGFHRRAAHVGYITDALYVPEVTTALKELAKLKEIVVDVESYLDIDVINNEKIKQNYNIISVGSGRVNLLTRELIGRFEDSLKVCFVSPNSGDIVSDVTDPPKVYSSAHPEDVDCGMLQLVCNPWAVAAGNKKIVILLAGNNPLGTVAVMYALSDMITYHIKNPGKPALCFCNAKNNIIPARVIQGTRKEYPPEYRKHPHTTYYIGNLNTEIPEPIVYRE